MVEIKHKISESLAVFGVMPSLEISQGRARTVSPISLEARSGAGQNRFNGFDRVWETVETVLFASDASPPS